MKRVLHVGCGFHKLSPYFDEYKPIEEVRLDIEPRYNPDIVASITDLGDIGVFDGVFSSHTLEHLYPHEVAVALSEFYRVLKPGGIVVSIVPDLEDVRPNEEVLYTTSDGPVTGLDLIYGLRRYLKVSSYMAHHTGFTKGTMHRALQDAGFAPIEIKRMVLFNLMAIGVK